MIKKNCSPAWLETVDQKKYQIPFKANQSVFSLFAPVFGVYFIQTGTVKIFLTGANGNKQIVRFASQGHLFGHRGSKNETYGFNASSMNDSVICFIENHLLNDLFENNPMFSVSVMMYYSQELRKMENRLKNMAQMCIREKISDAINMLWESFGTNKNHELEVPRIREVIADIAGTNIEQVSRQISDFEVEGIIQRRGKKIVLKDPEKLKKILSDYYIS